MQEKLIVNPGVLIDEKFLPAAMAMVTNAEKSIYVSTFKIEVCTKLRAIRLLQFFKLLVKKKQEGVDVRVITNKRDNRGHIPETNAYALHYMQKNKIPVRCLHNNRLCHAKLLIVDEALSIVGSHNLSVRSCHNNFEVSILTGNIPVVELLVSRYNELWEKSKNA